MKNRFLGLSLLFFCLSACQSHTLPTPTPTTNDLVFSSLATTWDEGIPLGNAVVGALVWQKDSSLRFSLDRTDLWDLRPMDSISGPNNRFAWVCQQIRKKDYRPVQIKFDEPYEFAPAPSKIPGAALEFPINSLGEVENVRLYLNNALCEVRWKNGAQMKAFVHATEPVGWFVFENIPTQLIPNMIPPQYKPKNISGSGFGNSVEGSDLRRLGYEQGTIKQEANQITYHQKGWDNFYYDVTLHYEQKGSTLRGVWSVTSSLSQEEAITEVQNAWKRGISADYHQHQEFWKIFNNQSSITLPDSLLQKQYANEMYKFGSAAREYSYPISLQAVWTADNGKLPPWKGDYHHDLNTQLSYWPAYTGNHLTEGLGYLNTLWNQRDIYKKYTRQYFETEGMNIPGVCTLTGEPMGGWIQYSMSQTVGAWLAQHFYLHWKYSMDKTFLQEKAYPFIRDVAIYLEQISSLDENRVRKLQFSSSPEINDNSISAWFKDMTNYDLALMHFLFQAAEELATECNLPEEAQHWNQIKSQLPALDIAQDGSLTFSKGFPYNMSHRHFSHAMAIHPLGIIDWSQGEKAQRTIRATLQRLDSCGPGYWTGYSYSWLGNIKARALDGEGAAQALRTFAECFCLKNTFHANGDQTKSGKSYFTYRPFTLEGNFAFAAGIQEMLLQSHTGTIRLFPAIPKAWKDVSFHQLRAMGAFLVSAEKKNGKTNKVIIFSEKGGALKLYNPFSDTFQVQQGHLDKITDILETQMQAGETLILISEEIN